ncbi:MAG: pseudouridine synthase [Microbacterium sp.]
MSRTRGSPRDACEDYIVAGRVRVNGRVVTELGTRIDPASDLVDVDGTAVQLDATKRYIMLNKPTGVVSSMKDEQAAPTSAASRRSDRALYNVGRLDADKRSARVTNDGDLAHVLRAPSFGVTKVYIAKVSGRVTAQTIATSRRWVELDDGPIAADKARLLDASSTGERGTSLVELTLHSPCNASCAA